MISPSQLGVYSIPQRHYFLFCARVLYYSCFFTKQLHDRREMIGVQGKLKSHDITRDNRGVGGVTWCLLHQGRAFEGVV